MIIKGWVWFFIIIFLPFAAIASQDQEPVATYFFVDFYGFGPLNVGDVVTAYDEDGVLSGKYVVTAEGQYGFLHVYGDDPSTDVDEGADA